MGMYDLAEAGVDINMKYNSMAAHYWRNKLHQIFNGLIPDEEMPSKD